MPQINIPAVTVDGCPVGLSFIAGPRGDQLLLDLAEKIGKRLACGFARKMTANNERDFVGYGRTPPDPRWPNGARLALVIVLNVEEGAEPSILDGDDATETALTDGIRDEVPAGMRDFVAKSLFEYGSRVGFWRIVSLMRERGMPLTVNACAQALSRNPQIANAIKEYGFDLCCHGDRFVRHFLLSEEEERRPSRAPSPASNSRPLAVGRIGWQSRYSPSRSTRALLVEHGGFLYNSDSYADDWPYWVKVGETASSRRSA